MESFHGVNFSLFEENLEWGYKIYQDNNTILLISTEWFESEGEARLAAFGHISLIQQGVEHD